MAKRRKVIDTFTPAIKAAIANAPKAVHENMEIVANAALAQAMENIPVDKGTARRSLRMVDRTKGSKVAFVVGTSVTDKGYPYPQALEFGTKRIDVGSPESPRTAWDAKSARGGGWEMMPWLRPAIRKVRPLMEKVLRAAFGKSFKLKEGGK